ncbi:MAG: DNA adenine methylase [Myxococcota bacterium]|jgi:DNA adenine methylase
MKPILKWAGGKARLAPTISEAFRTKCKGTYYEPFIGSAAVYLHRKTAGEVSTAVLADINPKLVHVHCAIRDCLDDVLEELSKLPREGFEAHYYGVREQFNVGPYEGALHAARFIWLNRACFNGLYRENKKGFFNVPVGRYKKVSLPPVAAFRAVSEALQDAEIRVADFREIVALAGPNDQVYCDPPYVPLTATANFTGYAKGAFADAEQRALAYLARKAALSGALVVLSNHDTPYVVDDLYTKKAGFKHVARPRVARAISRAAAGRVKVGEVIASIGPRSVKSAG